ncbi:MAG TPA: serine/threonine-protein kinase [Candidatus Dormibacteraeota bacterium]|nr:serine/threonine-protein kinase [Candidatus Dormibacteraeota bacterium]
MTISPGTRLGQYEVQDFIGQGAMGLVYRAYHSQLERTGAVKVLQAMSPDPDTTARFKHEAQAIAQMRHPNIVNVYDFGENQGTPYMIVEYVPGGSLATRMSERPLDQSTALKYLRGIAAGLDYAHSKGIVHRDVKPANVLLEADDTPVLADFGLAKLLQGSSLKSMTGVTTGTPAYMAPEQVAGSKVGPAADRYSLATIAYEMLTGVIPFDGEALMELLYAQVHRYPPAPSTRNPSLTPAVDDVVMRGLAKNPADRWESCGDFVDALAAALHGEKRAAGARTVVMRPPADVAAAVPASAVAATVAGPLSAAELAADSTPMTLAYPSPPAPAPKKSHRLRWALGALAIVIALLVVATAGYLLIRPRPSLQLSSGVVRAGGTLVVTVSNGPADQQGEVQLMSVVHSVPFQADTNGNATVYLTVPLDTQPGDHTVQVCWGSICPAAQTVLVLAPAAPPSPTPTSTPTPGASPTPTAGPSPAARMLALGSGRVPRGGTLYVSGQHFLPDRTITLYFTQGSTTIVDLPRQFSSSGGTFVDKTFKVPSSASVGAAAVRACDPAACAFATFTVTG